MKKKEVKEKKEQIVVFNSVGQILDAIRKGEIYIKLSEGNPFFGYFSKFRKVTYSPIKQ